MTTRTIDTIDNALDRIEARLPLIPKRTVRLQRTLLSVGYLIGRSAFNAVTSSGRRADASARTSAKTVAGQARAQTKETADVVEREAASLLGRAERAVEGESSERLESWTKAELYERAQELDIDGRSKMNKKQLVSALRSH